MENKERVSDIGYRVSDSGDRDPGTAGVAPISRAERIQAPRGTKDILPEEAAKWRAVERAVDEVAALYGYGEIRTPSFEQLRLFKRAVGEETDIVSKEMFLLQSRSDEEEFALRPELTAPVVRAAIEHGLLTGQSDCVRLYYNRAANFRYEKPQKGRFRQFHQFGTELLGPSSPLADAETISFAISVFRNLGLSDFRIRLNSLGSRESRDVWKQELVPYLRSHYTKLSKDSQRRTETNPLRVLDSKAPEDREIIQNAPCIQDFLTPVDKQHFNSLNEVIRRACPYAGVEIAVDPLLVRGIDYYTGPIFEFTSIYLGAQDALCAGGRYDSLVEQLGGPATPAVGFGGGMERLLIALGRRDITSVSDNQIRSRVYVIAHSDEGRTEAFIAASKLREIGIPAFQDLNNRSVKAQMREANRQECQFVYFIDESGVNSNQLKDMGSGVQEPIVLDRVGAVLEEKLKPKLLRPNT